MVVSNNMVKSITFDYASSRDSDLQVPVSGSNIDDYLVHDAVEFADTSTDPAFGSLVSLGLIQRISEGRKFLQSIQLEDIGVPEEEAELDSTPPINLDELIESILEVHYFAKVFAEAAERPGEELMAIEIEEELRALEDASGMSSQTFSKLREAGEVPDTFENNAWSILLSARQNLLEARQES